MEPKCLQTVGIQIDIWIIKQKYFSKTQNTLQTAQQDTASPQYRNHYRCIFRFKSRIQAKPMALMEKARWELSISAIFDISYLSMKPQRRPLYGLILVTPEIWFEIGIKSGFDLRPIFRLMIWFDNSHKHPWFDLGWSRFCVDLIWICPPLDWTNVV